MFNPPAVKRDEAGKVSSRFLCAALIGGLCSELFPTANGFCKELARAKRGPTDEITPGAPDYSLLLGPPVVPVYMLGEGSPTKIDCNKGTLILTSLLEDLDSEFGEDRALSDLPHTPHESNETPHDTA